MNNELGTMLSLPLTLLFTISFFLIAWYRFRVGLFFLFLLLPTYLIRFHVGPVPSTLLEVMIGILLLVWIIREWQLARAKKDFFVRLTAPIRLLYTTHRSLAIALTLFLLGATISVYTAVHLRAAAGEWRAFFIEPVLLFFLLIVTVKNKKDRHAILLGLLLCGLITSFLSIYQHFTGFMVPWSFWQNRHTYRVTGWYGYPNAVGLGLAPLLPLAWYGLLENTKTRKQENKKTLTVFVFLFSCFFVLTATLALIFAKGVGPMIGALAGIGVILGGIKKIRPYLLTVGIIAIIGFCLLPSTNLFKQKLLAQSDSGKIRRDMWAETTEYLSHHPIAGTGLASYATRIWPYRINKHIEVFSLPHNLFLSIWVEIGLIGLMGFIWIIVWFYRVSIYAMIKNTRLGKQPDHIILALIASMTTIMVMGLVDTPYLKNDLVILFWVLPALLICSLPATSDT